MVERNALARYLPRPRQNQLAAEYSHWNSYSAVPGPFNRQAALDTAAVGLSPVPVLGDLAGLGADAHMYWNEPESRTWGNALMTGAGLFPGIPGAAAAKMVAGVGMLAGKRAATANMRKLTRAVEMSRAGDDPVKIWDETGWFQGGDGEWRFEIDDSASAYSAENIPLDKSGYKVGTLDSGLQHNQLFKGYPDLRESQLVDYDFAHPNAKFGEYRHAYDYGGILGKQPESITMWEGNKSTALHESQHAIQAREGFGRGGNPGSMSDLPLNPRWEKWKANQDVVERGNKLYASPQYQAEMDASNKLWKEKYDPLIQTLSDELDNAGRGPKRKAVYEEMNKVFAMADAEKAKRFPVLTEVDSISREYGLKEPKQHISAHEAYSRLAGEVEARNVQTRMNMTPEQRRASPPWTTEDVPADQQIIRKR